MKKLIRQFFLIWLSFSTFTSFAQLGQGDIMIIGFKGDGNGAGAPPSLNCGDGFSFVCLVEVPAGTEVIFTEEEWLPTSFKAENEGHIIWTSAGVPAGTVVDVTTHGQAEVMAGTCGPLEVSAGAGTVAFGDDGTGMDNWALSSSNEEIYVYQGTPGNPTNWISAFFTNGFGTDSDIPTGASGLVGYVTDLGSSPDADVAFYSGPTDCPNQGDCLSNILDVNNWTTTDDAGFDPPGNIPPDFQGLQGCDTAPPITCPPNMATTNDPEQCGAMVTIPPLVIGDHDCAIVSVVNDFNGTDDASGFYPVGSTMVTYTVTDDSGNEATCTFEVAVADNEPPVIACQDVTIALNASGTVDVSVRDVVLSRSDNCDEVDLSLDRTTFGCGDIGPNVVTLTATDQAGNTATCLATVTIIDTTPPVAVANNITVVLDGTGNATISPADVDGGSTDACGPLVLAVSPNSFNCDNVGTATVTLTVMDGSGNISTDQATATVTDQTPPTAITQNISVQLGAGGTVTVNPGQVDNGSSDACGIASFSFASPPPGGGGSCPDPQLFLPLGNGTDGEGIAFNPNDGLIYHTSGRRTGFEYFETINLNTKAIGPNIFPGNEYPGGISEVRAISWYPPINAFLGADGSKNWFTLTPDGTLTVLATADERVRGLGIVGTRVFGVANFTGTLYELDPANGGVIQEIVTTVDGVRNPGANALATNPLTGEMYIAFNAERGTDTRHLGIIDINTGAITDFGDTGLNIAGLTFDSSGQLYGVSGDGSAIPETLFTFDCNSASAAALGARAASAFSINSASFDAGGEEFNTNGETFSTTGANGESITFNCSDVGDNEVTLIVTDVNGNISTANAIITVLDGDPEVVTQDIVVELDANGSATITAEMIDNGSTDECGIDQLMVEPSTFDCSNIGPNEVTLTVTDINGNMATGMAVVTVIDVTPPTAVAQDIMVQLDATGNAMISASDIDGGSSDNCGIDGLSVSPNVFTCANVGPNPVTLTVVDISGNISTATATVTVKDNPPVAVTQNISIQLDGTGNASITPADVDGGSTDDCGIALLSVTPSNFTCADVGSNTVILTVLDVNGNTSSAPAIVEVSDNAPIALAKDITVELDENGNVSINPGQVDNGSSDDCGIASLSVSPNTFSCADVGPNEVTLTVTDVNGNSSSANATVNVVDASAPIVMVQDISVDLDENGNATITPTDIDAGSSDNCGIASLSVSPSSFTCANVGANTVTLTVTDVNGNTTSANATVTVNDVSAPNVVTQNITVQLDAGGNATIVATDVDGGSTDNCGIAAYSVSPSSFTCADVGPNTVTLTVTDVNGNSASASATVTVEDMIAPTVVAQDISVQLDATGNASITPADVDNGSSDNCGIATLSVSPSSFDCSNVGTNTVTLTVTDVNGNTSSTTATVTVADAIAPTAVAQDITVQLDAHGNATVTPAIIDGGSTDNCAIDTYAVHPSTFDCMNLGANTVTLTVTDVNGNSSSATATVTVEDNVAPNVQTKDVVVTLDEEGNGSITIADIDNGTSDACGIAALSLDLEHFTCADIGHNTVTLTAVDVNGNESSETATVSVVDEIAPVVVLAFEPYYKKDRYLTNFSAEDQCDPFSEVKGVIQIPDLSHFEIDFKREKVKKGKVKKEIKVDYKKGKVTVKAPDPVAFYEELMFCGGFEVENGDETKIKHKKDEFKIKFETGKELKIYAPAVTLMVTAIDFSGNERTETTTLVLRKGKRGDDDEDEEDEDDDKGKKKKKGRKGKKDKYRTREIATESTDDVLVSEVELTLAQPSVTLYPNPFTEYLQVEFESAVDDRIEVGIYNLMGAKVGDIFSGEVMEGDLLQWSFTPEEHLAQGVLLLHIRGNKTNLTERFIYKK